MSLIRLFDVSGLFWPIWRAKEGAGKPVGEAASETVQALREHAARAGADHVVACCDAPGRTFRHDIAEEYKALVPDFKGYKGHRPDKDAAMMACLDRVIDELEQDGIPVMRVPGVEADDVIATIAHWATREGHSVEIVSEDKDLLSLVLDPDADNDTAPAVTVIRRDGTRQGYNACVERLGVPPHLVPAFLALNGDKSDGILGVPNVGGTWAVRLLWGRFDETKQWRPSPFKSFDDVVNAAIADQAALEASERERAEAKANKVRPLPAEYRPKFPENVRKSLIANAASFEIGLRLARLRTDVPLDFAAVTAPKVPKPRADKTNIDPALMAVFNDPENQNMDPIDAVIAPPSDQAAPVAPPPSAAAPPAPSTEGAARDTSQAVVVSVPSPAKTATASQAITTVSRPYEMQLEPANFGDAVKLAEHLAKARMFKDIADASQALIKMAVGRSIGLNLMQSLTLLHVMEGKITMAAQMVLARCKTHPDCEYFRRVSGDKVHAEWIAKRRGEPEQKWCFTIEDAKTAKLGGSHKAENKGGFAPDSNWAKYPQQMCSWRAVMFLAREVFPEVAAGIYDPDEIREQREAPSLEDAA